MAKKKGLLNEATVRRFMGLAGMESNLVSNTLKEMYSKRDDEKEEEDKMEEAMYAEEEPAADDESDMGDMGDMDAEEPEMDMGGDSEVELSPEDIKDARAAVEKLLAPLEAGMPKDGEADMDLGDEPADEPEMDMGGDDEAPEAEDEEVIAEALSGINIELTGDDLVQEVTKRVARRLLKAKKAQQALDEALGKSSPKYRRTK